MNRSESGSPGSARRPPFRTSRPSAGAPDLVAGPSTSRQPVPAVSDLLVVGSALSEPYATTSKTQRPATDGGSSSVPSGRFMKPSEVIAAAVAEIQDADSKSLLKLQQLRTATPNSPVRKRASSAYAPGALPALPPSPNASNILNRQARTSDAQISILANHPVTSRQGEMNSAGQPFSPVGRRITSAPDSQSLRMIGQQGTDPWQPVLHEPLRTGPGVLGCSRADLVSHSSMQLPAQAAPFTQLSSAQQPADASPKRNTPGSAHDSGLYSPALRHTGPASITVLHSPRSGESSPGMQTPTPGTAQHRLATQSPVYSPHQAGYTPSPTHTPNATPSSTTPAGAHQLRSAFYEETSQTSTPTSATPGGLWPRPPSSATTGEAQTSSRLSSPPLRTRRRSIMTSPDSKIGSPRHPDALPSQPAQDRLLSQYAQSATSSQRTQSPGATTLTSPTNPTELLIPLPLVTASSGGAWGSGQLGTGPPSNGGGRVDSLASPAQTPTSRPSSGRSRAVQLLLDAVRSRDEARFRDMMDYLTMSNGCVAGLNDRHTVTGRTPLHEAVMLNSTAMVRALLAAGADPHLGHMSQGPPLLHAAAWGETGMLQLLLDAGADVNARDIAGYTALHYACAGGHVEAARVLLERGADSALLTNDGDTAMILATSHPSLLTQVFGVTADELASHSSSFLGQTFQHDQLDSNVCDVTLSPANSAQIVQHAQQASPGDVQGDVQGVPTASEPATLASSSGKLLKPVPPIAAAPLGGSFRSKGVTFDDAGPGASEQPGVPPSVFGTALCSQPSTNIDDKLVQPPPPALELPRGVRRQLSKGAVLQDIIHAFEDEDNELVRRHSSTGEHSNEGLKFLPPSGVPLLEAFGQRLSKGGAADASPARPNSGKAAPAPAPGFQVPTLQTQFSMHAQSAVASPATTPAGTITRQTSFAAPVQRVVSTTSQANSALNSPSALSGLAAAVPITPRFRFGVDIHKHPPMQQGSNPPAASGGSQTAQGSTAVGASGFTRRDSTPVQHTHGADPVGAYGRSASSAHLLPAPSIANESAQGEGVSESGLAQEQEARTSQGLPHAHSNLTLDVSSDLTPPPLVRDHSPPQSPMNASFRKRVGGAGLGGAGGVVDSPKSKVMASFSGMLPGNAQQDTGPFRSPTKSNKDSGLPDSAWLRHSIHAGAPSGAQGEAGALGAPQQQAGRMTPAVWAEGVNDPERVSQAAQALVAQAGRMGASHEALQLRAMQMFSRSVELQTGGIQWTRGELLGEGSYGRVYAGLNQLTGELMAVKVLELLMRSHGMQDAILAQLEELTRELELYKKLCNKHVVGYIDHHFDARTTTLYIFLEYVPGGSIASMLERFGRFSEELVRNYTRQLLLGLDYLHSCRVVHRDLKGGNVLVTRDGVIKLADFGASKAFASDTITDGMKSIKGSVFWMAPEVIKGTGYNYKADIWSLGCTVIEMLTGKHPWPQLDNPLTAMFQIAKQSGGPPRPPAASPMALDFLSACLKYEPRDRPSTADLLQHAFVTGVEAPRPRGAAS